MGWITQSKDKDVHIKVKSDYDRKGEAKGKQRTDFLVIDRKTGEKNHYSVGTGKNSEVKQWH